MSFRRLTYCRWHCLQRIDDSFDRSPADYFALDFTCTPHIDAYSRQIKRARSLSRLSHGLQHHAEKKTGCSLARHAEHDDTLVISPIASAMVLPGQFFRREPLLRPRRAAPRATAASKEPTAIVSIARQGDHAKLCPRAFDFIYASRRKTQPPACRLPVTEAQKAPTSFSRLRPMSAPVSLLLMRRFAG